MDRRRRTRGQYSPPQPFVRRQARRRLLAQRALILSASSDFCASMHVKKVQSGLYFEPDISLPDGLIAPLVALPRGAPGGYGRTPARYRDKSAVQIIRKKHTPVADGPQVLTRRYVEFFIS